MAKAALLKECGCCGGTLSPSAFSKTGSPFFSDNRLNICDDCIEKMIKEHDGDLSFIDKLCQWADYPFLVNEWVKLYSTNKEKTFKLYVQIFNQTDYLGIDWSKMNEKWKLCAEEGTLEAEVDLLRLKKIELAKKKWGYNYDDEDIEYLEGLYEGMMATQNINGTLSTDQAIKLCKISRLIDNKIRGEEDFKDDLNAYKELVKIGDFTPKNIKNAGDFDSVGEVYAYLEKRGWVNKYYDNVARDIVDSTMKNIQAWTRKLYTNETGIAEDIEKRIEGLKIAKELENADTDIDGMDLDRMDKDAYDIIEEEDFIPDIV